MSNLEHCMRVPRRCNLHGLLAHWARSAAANWVGVLLDWEEQERARRSWSGACATPILAASNRSATSIGPGPNAAIAQPSKR